MKRPARRIMIGAALVGAGIVAVLVVTHWDPVRDHFEAWHFQLTMETVTIEPGVAMPEKGHAPEEHLLQGVASRLGRPLVFSPEQYPASVGRSITVSKGGIVEIQAKGWRIIEQRAPRRAYVLIRQTADPLEEPIPQGILWDGLDLPAPVE